MSVMLRVDVSESVHRELKAVTEASGGKTLAGVLRDAIDDVILRHHLREAEANWARDPAGHAESQAFAARLRAAS